MTPAWSPPMERANDASGAKVTRTRGGPPLPSQGGRIWLQPATETSAGSSIRIALHVRFIAPPRQDNFVIPIVNCRRDCGSGQVWFAAPRVHCGVEQSGIGRSHHLSQSLFERYPWLITQLVPRPGDVRARMA